MFVYLYLSTLLSIVSVPFLSIAAYVLSLFVSLTILSLKKKGSGELTLFSIKTEIIIKENSVSSLRKDVFNMTMSKIL